MVVQSRRARLQWNVTIEPRVGSVLNVAIGTIVALIKAIAIMDSRSARPLLIANQFVTPRALQLPGSRACLLTVLIRLSATLVTMLVRSTVPLVVFPLANRALVVHAAPMERVCWLRASAALPTATAPAIVVVKDTVV